MPRTASSSSAAAPAQALLGPLAALAGMRSPQDTGALAGGLHATHSCLPAAHVVWVRASHAVQLWNLGLPLPPRQAGERDPAGRARAEGSGAAEGKEAPGVRRVSDELLAFLPSCMRCHQPCCDYD